MIRVLGARRPARVDKSVMEKLLNVVEIVSIISEHSNASNRLLHRWFVATPNGLHEIMPKQANHPVCIRL